MSSSPVVDPPTRPLYRPRVSRAAADAVGADAVTETTMLRKVPTRIRETGPREARALDAGTIAVGDLDAATTTVQASPGPGGSGAPVASPPSGLPQVRRLPGPSETGRFPSPKPRASEVDAETVMVSSSDLAATRAPASRPTPTPTPTPQSGTEAPAGPAPRPSTGPRPAVAVSPAFLTNPAPGTIADPPSTATPTAATPTAATPKGTETAAATAAPVRSSTPAPAASPVRPAGPARHQAPARTGSPGADSAAALERAGLAGLHPLTRAQPVRRRGTRRMVAQVPAPYSLVGDGEDVPALLTRMYAMVVRDHWGGGDGDTTHVVQLTPWYACDLGFELVSAGRILGHAPVHGDVTPDVPVDPPEPDDPASAPPGAPTPTIVSLRHPSIDETVRSALADAERVIVVTDTARSDRRTVQQNLVALGELGVVVAGLVVYRGRIPRDPSYSR